MNGNRNDDSEFRKLWAKMGMTDSEYEALRSLDPLVKALEEDKQFRSELAVAMKKRGILRITVVCENPVVERALKLMEVGVPECQASPHRQVKNITLHLINAAIEQSGES